MSLFSRRKDYSVCRMCKVHFEPVTGWEAEHWPDLCETHRREPRDRHIRKQMVLGWAAENWEALEPQAKEAREKQAAAFQAAAQGSLAAMAQQSMQQQAMANQSNIMSLMGLAGPRGF